MRRSAAVDFEEPAFSIVFSLNQPVSRQALRQAHRDDPTADITDLLQRLMPTRCLDALLTIDKFGDRKEFAGKRNFPPTELGEILQLRPTTDETQLQTIRWIYTSYLEQSTTPGTLARQLNERGVETPPYSGYWQQWHVSEILKHPAYVGRPVWNRGSVADYMMYQGGKRVPRRPGSGKLHHDQSDWIMPDLPLYDPIVTIETFRAVQEKLARRVKRPRSAHRTYVYAGILICGHCGANMVGTISVRRNGKPAPSSYVCGTYQNCQRDREKCGCHSYRITEAAVDRFVNDFLTETLPLVSDLAKSQAELPRPRQLEAALVHAVEAYNEMLQRIGGTIVEGDGTSWVSPTDEMMMPVQDTAAVVARYMSRFGDESPALVIMLDELRTEQDELLEAIKKTPSSAVRMLQKIQDQITASDRRIVELEGQLQNAAEGFNQHCQEIAKLNEQWAEALKKLTGETHQRRRAEAIRQVIGKIVVRWRTTNLEAKRPTREAEEVYVLPVNTSSDCTNEGTSLPAINTRWRFSIPVSSSRPGEAAFRRG